MDNQQLQQLQQLALDKNASDDALGQWLVRILGSNVIQAIRQNPNLRLPYVESTITDKVWLLKALKTILPLANIQDFKRHLSQQFNANSEAVVMIQQQQKELEQLYAKVNRMQRSLASHQRQQQKKTHTDFSNIPANYLIDAAFGQKTTTKGIQNLLHEAFEIPSETFKEFLIAFYTAWMDFQTTLQHAQENEKTRVRFLYEELKVFLKKLNGLYITQRRALLEEVAAIASMKLQKYLFISPEETLQINPKIHNIVGGNGLQIKEGVSFAVVRKTSKQTYLYADVIVY